MLKATSSQVEGQHLNGGLSMLVGRKARSQGTQLGARPISGMSFAGLRLRNWFPFQRPAFCLEVDAANRRGFVNLRAGPTTNIRYI